MEIKEILELDYSKENLKIIDKYLAKEDKESLDYLKAKCKKIILLSDSKLNESLKEIYNYVIDFNILSDEKVVLICNTIMKLTLKAKRYDEYLKYLKIKKGRLPFNETYICNYDLFLYYQGVKNYPEAITYLYNYLDNDLNISERLKALNDLLNLTFSIKNYDLFFKTLKQIKEINENNNITNELNLDILEIIMLYEKGHYEDVINKSNIILNTSNINNEDKINISNYLIKSLIEINNLRKASIIESDYRELLSNDYLKLSLEFSKTALDLYNRLEHNLSIKYYENKINDFNKEIKKSENKIKKEIYVIPELIDENKIEEKEIKEVKKEKIKEEIFAEQIIASNNKFIRNIVDIINKEIRLRDILIKIGDLFKEKYQIIKFNLIYKADKYYLHTYKNSKVYDRSYINLADSFIKYCFNEGEIFFLDEDLIKDNKDIFTNEVLDAKYVVSMPFKDLDKTIGIIEVLSENDFLKKDNNYDEFKTIVKILNIKIRECINDKLNYYQNEVKNYVLNNANFGFKIINQNKLILDNFSSSLLKLDKECNIDEFYTNIDSKIKKEYEDLIIKLLESKENNKEIYYLYKDKYIKEIFYPTYIDSDLIIISIISDETKLYDKEQTYKKEAYIDNSGFNNLNKLNLDLENLKEKRYSLAIFSNSDLINYKDVYGLKFYLDFLTSLYKNTKLYFNNYYNISYYMIDMFHFALVLIDFKDKRKEETLLKNYLNYLTNSFTDLKYSIHPIFNMGVYLHSKDENKEINLIYDYAYNAYLDSVKKDELSYYSYKNYKDRFKEKERAILLKENILNNQIKVRYTQLVDLLKEEVYGYVVNLSLPNLNIYEDEIAKILIKENNYNLYQKYKLTTLSLELKKFYNEVGAYIEVLVSFTRDVINDYFSEFVLTQLNFFKIPPNVLSIIVDKIADNMKPLQDKGIKIITKDLYDIINKKTKYILLDLSKLDSANLNLINEVLNKLDTTIYLANVDTKDVLKSIKDANISYVYGNCYSKTFSIDDLILKMKN